MKRLREGFRSLLKVAYLCCAIILAWRCLKLSEFYSAPLYILRIDLEVSKPLKEGFLIPRCQESLEILFLCIKSNAKCRGGVFAGRD